METIKIGTRPLVLPALIPSISSFETQIAPVAALRLQITMQEPVSLVSAYDLSVDTEGRLAEMCRKFRQNGVMFLDSGGYEVSRMNRYAGAKDWSLERYLDLAAPDLFDFAFSFDEFPNPPDQSWQEYAGRLEVIFDGHNRKIADAKLIPVIHLSDRDGHNRYSDEEAVELVTQVAESRNFQFVAVTEREMGAGLAARAALVGKIKSSLSANTETKLHILGCGNPLAFSVFAQAGADSCDGLEWCRTYCSSDMRLYHFQHSEAVGHAIQPLTFQAEMLLDNTDDYYIRTSVVNLNNFSHIVRAVQSAPQSATAFIEKAYGEPIRL